MTGIVTAAMISLIIFGSDMRATPPWARMSAGTRSKAITAQAPASSAILAWSGESQHFLNEFERGPFFLHTCSALTTSIMTPPFNMRARPVLTVKLDSGLPFWAMPEPPLMGSSVAILQLWLIAGEFAGGGNQ